MSTAAAPGHVDPTRNSRYELKFTDSSQLQSITYNHKFNRAESPEDSVISHDGDKLKLSMRGAEGEVEYEGIRNSDRNFYLLEMNGGSHSFKLQPLEAQYIFNLTATPTEKSASKLAAAYKHIDSTQHINSQQDEVNPESGDEENEDDEPDPDNPYDYRHYLHGIPGADTEPRSRVASAATTPVLAATSAGKLSQHSTRPIEKRPVNTKAQSKVVRKVSKPRKVAAERPEPKLSSKSPPSQTQANSSGGLIIDNDSPSPPPKKQKFLAASNGPISLSRATSTPAQDVGSAATPLQISPDHDHHSKPASDVSDEDDDVDDFRLPGPAAVTAVESEKPDLKRRQSVWEDAEVEDLLAALDDEPDQTMQSAAGVEGQSDSESEEE